MYTLQNDLDKLIKLHTQMLHATHDLDGRFSYRYEDKSLEQLSMEYDDAYAKFVQDYGHARK